MKSIDYQTKLLLRSKDLQNPKSFADLGYIYFGPLLFNFFAWLCTNINDSDKILFNSREGFFLEKIYKIFQAKYNLPESVYFKTSRKISSLSAMFNKQDIYNTFQFHRYSGYLSNLLKDRFGINPTIDSDYLLDTKETIPNLEMYIDDILSNSVGIRHEYGKYISGIIGDSKNITMIDSGYQGTTQYYIQKAYGLTFSGRYITFKGNEHLKNVIGFYEFNKTKFQQNIIFFESVFIDRVGSFVDIKNGEFINEPFEEKTHFFEQKEQIVEGITKFVEDMLECDVDMESATYEYSDYIFDLMCKRDFIKNIQLTDIFYHDNYYTRDSVKKITRN